MKKLNLLSWFLIALLVTSIVGMIGNIGPHFFSENKNIIYDYKFWSIITSNLLFYSGIFFAQKGIHLIKKEVSFTNKSNDYFTKSALFLIISSLLHCAIIFVNYNESSKDVAFINLAFYFLVIILALFLFAISDIVKLGKTYQEENNLTI
jgi:ABC-type multidrug transport system fused ATPase/permease subunit